MLRAYRPEEKEIRRQAILAGALQMFRETPFPDLHMIDLAQRLGLGKGTLYLYFPTKEALFLAVLQAEMGAWFQAAARVLDDTPAGADPAAVARELVRELVAHPLLPGSRPCCTESWNGTSRPPRRTPSPASCRRAWCRWAGAWSGSCPGCPRGGAWPT